MVDQKKDIVSLFADCQQDHVIHSCSSDKSICSYDLKKEQRIQSRQIANGINCGMAQRIDSELELVTAG